MCVEGIVAIAIALVFSFCIIALVVAVIFAICSYNETRYRCAELKNDNEKEKNELSKLYMQNQNEKRNASACNGIVVNNVISFIIDDNMKILKCCLQNNSEPAFVATDEKDGEKVEEKDEEKGGDNSTTTSN